LFVVFMEFWEVWEDIHTWGCHHKQVDSLYYLPTTTTTTNATVRYLLQSTLGELLSVVDAEALLKLVIMRK